MKTPDQKTETVGGPDSWKAWAKSQVNNYDRAKELIRMGCFTVEDFQKQTPGWTRHRCFSFLYKSGLKFELAIDPRTYNGRKTRFYFPPKK